MTLPASTFTRVLALLLALAADFASGASLWPADSDRANLPPEGEPEPPLTLHWTRPAALAEGFAALLPSNRAEILDVEVDDRVRETHPRLQADTLRDVFRWRLESGDAQLTPLRNGSRCRLFPRASAEKPIVVSVRMTRTYVEPARPFRRARERQFTATVTGRIVAPVSGERLSAQGWLEGFEIGRYPNPRDPVLLAGLGGTYNWVQLHAARFEPPPWFHSVTRQSRGWPISEHIRLGDFTIDERYFTLGMPQWVAIDPLLISKLEELAAEMHRAGHAFAHWSFIYGFRSPSYNARRREIDGRDSLKSPFSQHMFGRAADIIIDTDGDGILDDLDGDGAVTVRDAAVIMRFVNALDRRLRAVGDPRVGGAGLYGAHDFFERADHVGQTPYVHVDVRGFVHEDGTLFRWPSRWPDTGEPIPWGDRRLGQDDAAPAPVSL
jgi:hypothetical protein